MATEASIRKTIRRLQEALEKRKTKLIGQLDQLTQQKMKSLAAQRDKFELVQTRLSSCLDFVSESLRTGSQAEILAAKKPVVQQIEEMTAEFKPELLVPAEHTDLKFTTTAELTPACRRFGKVHACHVTGKGLEVATVGEQATVTMDVVDAEGQECKKNITCELVSCRDATSVKCSVKKREGNQYEVSYQPTSRGRHQLHIKVESQHIRGSPFAVFAKLPIQKLGIPIRTIDSLNEPWGVAVNERGQIVVVEHDGHCVSIFSANGRKIKTFGVRSWTPGQFNGPHGVAVDHDESILVADMENSRIQKFTSRGWFTTAVGSKGFGPLQFSYPVGISINPRNKKVYVADNGNHRIQILNCNLTYSSRFGSQGSGNEQFQYPRDVAFYSTGMVYIADFGNCCIKVFTEVGQFPRKFRMRGTGGELYRPSSIAIDSDDVVYVTEYDNHRVSIFTCQGQFLRSFGSCGTGPGQFNTLRGIAVDRDGLVYISDFWNHRVQIF